MALPLSRIHQGAETEHPWEREAIDYILRGLPDVDPYQAWPLHELSDPGSGRLYEIDILILGYHALYLIEIKSHPGDLNGDALDWYFTHQGMSRPIENPLRLANQKAKILATLLRRELPPTTPIWVEPLVFLSNESLHNHLPDAARSHVVERSTVIRALTHGDYPGGQPKSPVTRPAMKEVVQVLGRLGLRPSVATRKVGHYILESLLWEGPGYQDHLAKHDSLTDKRARTRSYLVPRATTMDRRNQLGRAAKREAETLDRLGQHPAVLTCLDYVPDAPLGPALIFEPFEGALRLDSLLRVRPDLSFDQRIEIIRQTAEAIGFCHRQGVVHRGLSPTNVLVREGPGGTPVVKVHGFQLALRGEGSSGTAHLTGLVEADDLLYQAPEVIADPASATEESDIFSVGALAYLVLTGQAPAQTLPERERRLSEGRGLHIGAVRDDISGDLDAAIALATDPHPSGRPESAIEFLNQVLEAATAPSRRLPEVIVDPFEAQPDDDLGSGIVVVRELGSGSTARVLHVRREGRDLALKVPRDEGCAQRLKAEHEVMKDLRHSCIVASHGIIRIGERDCLLLDHAGDQTLAARLRSEGSFSLDYAKRYGEDLLGALQYLEERGILHRDIKPGNLGFTPDWKKTTGHLLLFDFSLASAPATAITVGTPSYRDPFLRKRGVWDVAADRFSAAVTMLEMLTGAPPRFENDTAVVETERFDAAARERFAVFFTRALATEVEDRFPSADSMRTEWTALFADHAPEAETPEVTPVAPTISGPGDSVEVLHLSTRARNALDRAGVVTVGDLAQLPRNQVSAIRGVGRKVANEIQDAAERVREILQQQAATTPQALVPTFRGRREDLASAAELGLGAAELQRLAEAGIVRTTDLATTPLDRVVRLVGSERAGQLAAALGGGQAPEKVAELSAWSSALLQPKGRRPSKTEQIVGALLGYSPLPGSQPPEPPKAIYREAGEVAKTFAISRPRVYQAVEHERERWLASEALDPLRAAASEVLAALGGVARLEEAATELARRHGSGSEVDARDAGALLRALAELQANLGEQAPVWLGRFHREAWLAGSSASLDALRAATRQAEALAKADQIPSSETVRQKLLGAVAGSPLETMPYARLIQLAAAATSHAAVSSRLELYKRGLPAARALTLSAAALAVPSLTPEELRRKVRERYPDADPLPERPALDALVEPLGLHFDQATGKYSRPGLEPSSLTGTYVQPTRLPSAQPGEVPLGTPGARAARDFDDHLKVALGRGRFRVIQVPSNDAEVAAKRLAAVTGIRPTSIDHTLEQHMRAQMKALGVLEDVVVDADRSGPTGPSWQQLCELARRAATSMVDEILSHRGHPYLLVNPGLLARYNLRDELQRLVERGEHEDGAAILLLVPSYEDGAPPAINGSLPVPAPLPGQRLFMPRGWLANEQHAGASGER